MLFFYAAQDSRGRGRRGENRKYIEEASAKKTRKKTNKKEMKRNEIKFFTTYQDKKNKSLLFDVSPFLFPLNR